MASDDADVEPALAWSVALVFACFALTGRLVVMEQFYTASPLLAPCAASLAAVFALLAGAVMFAMGEPLPRVFGENIPLRLRVCWGVLGACPPPGRSIRIALTAAVVVCYLFSAAELHVYDAGAAALLGAAAALLGKPAKVLKTDALEWAFLLGLCGVGLGALDETLSQAPATALGNFGVLALLVPLSAQRSREVCAARWAQLLPGIPPPPALDLSRYEVEVERQVAAERPALPPGAEEQLVDSGTFKVDAAKMLDKLRSYQLTDPRDFLCAWLRCAAASGAKSIHLTPGWAGLELSFDGRPFSAAELAQPYQALVDAEGTNALRGRHFAYGLLGLYRLRPRSVSVTSRGPAGVATMNAGTGSPPDPESAPGGTVFRVDWPAWAFGWRSATLAFRARRSFGLGPATLSVNGQAVPPWPQGWRHAKRQGWSAAVRKTRSDGRLRLFALGTFIEELASPLQGRDAWLGHDELPLDISQSAVVRGALFEEGLRTLKTLAKGAP